MADDPTIVDSKPADDSSKPTIPDHELLRCIGQGSYGQVWLAKNVTGQFRAVKVVYRSRFETSRPFDREFTGIQKYEPISRTHPGLVQILHVGINKEAGYFYCVMELADDQHQGQTILPEQYEPRTLQQELHNRKRLPLDECLQFGVALADALRCLHEKGLVHRDIKLSNIIFVGGIPKLADIGLIADTGQRTFVGTEGYIPPEGPGHPQGDIYALGKVLYELSSGRDRLEFPELQTDLEAVPDRPRWLDLNKVILTACAEAHLRYLSAANLGTDLARIQSGKSPRPRKWRLVSRFKQGLIFLVAVLVSALILLYLVLPNDFRSYLSYLRAGLTGEVFGPDIKVSHERVHKPEVDVRAQVERKNSEISAMLVKAAQSDRLIAEQKFQSQEYQAAFAHLARACEYDPSSTLAAEKAIATLNAWNHVLPTVIIDGEGEPVHMVRFSPDGTRIGGVVTNTVRVWDATTGKTLVTLAGDARWVYGEGYSSDRTREAWVPGDATALVRDAATGKTLAVLTGHTAFVYSVRLNLDGTRVVTASQDKTARVWDAVTGKTLVTLAGHTDEVGYAQFSPDGTRIVTTSRDKTARVWDVLTGKMLITLTGHTARVSDARFSPDGRCIATASVDKTVRVWDTLTGEMLVTLTGHAGWVNSVRFSPDGTRIVTASDDNTICVWDLVIGKAPLTLAGYKRGVNSVRFSPDGTRIATASWDKTARVWDALTGKMLVTLAGHEAGVYKVRFSPDGTRIATASWDKTARVWDALTGKLLVPLAGHTGVVCSVEFSPDGTRIVTASYDHTARVWDVATGQTLVTLAGHTGSVFSAQFSPDGMRIVTASFDYTARVWNATTGERHITLAGLGWLVRSAQFSPDGTRVVTASESDNTARVWDSTTGKTLATLSGHMEFVRHAQFSPDGTRIVTASGDHTARVWDATTGKMLVTLAGHEGWVESAQFSPDGTRIVTASEDKTARVWDATTGEMLVTLAGHVAVGYDSVPFSPDGTRIAAASDDSTVRVWDLLSPQAGVPPEWFPDFLRFMAQMRLNPDGKLERFKPTEWHALRERLRGVLLSTASADTPYLSYLRARLTGEVFKPDIKVSHERIHQPEVHPTEISPVLDDFSSGNINVSNEVRSSPGDLIPNVFGGSRAVLLSKPNASSQMSIAVQNGVLTYKQGGSNQVPASGGYASVVYGGPSTRLDLSRYNSFRISVVSAPQNAGRLEMYLYYYGPSNQSYYGVWASAKVPTTGIVDFPFASFVPEQEFPPVDFARVHSLSIGFRGNLLTRGTYVLDNFEVVTAQWNQQTTNAGSPAAPAAHPFTYTTNNSAITVTKYTGSNDAVTIPGMITGLPVTSIGDQAFFGRRGLTSITIPLSVTSIGDYAFDDCTSLTNIIIPAGVTNLGRCAIDAKHITVDAANTKYSSLDGVLFNKDQTTLIRCPGGKAGNYTIPASVTTIVEFAFSGCVSLTNITIPAGVTSIGRNAFYTGRGITVDAANPHYSSLDNVLFNKDQTVLVQCLGGKAGSYTIPASVTSIGDYAFKSCSGLSGITIPASVTKIGKNAFAVCRTLSGVYFQGNAPSLGNRSPFDRSDKVIVYYTRGTTGWGQEFGGRPTREAANGEVRMEPPSEVTELTDFTIATKKNRKITITKYTGPGGMVTIPSAINGLLVTSISDHAFKGCTNLNSVTIPNSVTSIGDLAFDGCTGLSDIAVPDSVTSLGTRAFYRCLSLTNITIGARVTKLPSCMLYRCDSLKGVTIPASVRSIGSAAFAFCPKLTEVYFQGNAPDLGDAAPFQQSDNAIVYYARGTTGWGKEFGGRPTALRETQTTGAGPESKKPEVRRTETTPLLDDFNSQDIHYTYTTNNNTITITKYTGSSGAVTIPSTITGLPVSTIGESTFMGCVDLTNITVPASVTDIKNYAFEGCPRLKAITVDAASTNFSGLDGVLFDKRETTLIRYPRGRVGSYAIPASVTRIGDYAFSCCEGLTNIIIPTTVTSIGKYAFNYCPGLTRVTIPTSVTSIGDDAFNNGLRLTEVTIPASVTRIGESVFGHSKRLTSITVDSSNTVYSSVAGVLFNKSQTALLQYPSGLDGSYAIPASVTSIGDYAFSGCMSLTNIIIPTTVTSIGRYAFDYCLRLTEVTIPASVTRIGESVFARCKSLTSITVDSSNAVYSSVAGVLFNKSQTALLQYPGGLDGSYAIPPSVTSIEKSAFSSCEGLTNITIPSTVRDIEDWAFSHCRNLRGVYFLGNAPGGNATVFSSTDNVNVYYLSGTMGWGNQFGGRPTAQWNQQTTNAVSPTAPAALPFTYTIKNREITITKYTGSSEAVTIPSTITGLPVTSIGDNAFFGCWRLTTITIPTSVTSIGSSAFADCGGLTNITIPAGVTSIGENAFQGCTKLPTAIQNLARRIPAPQPVPSLPVAPKQTVPVSTKRKLDFQGAPVAAALEYYSFLTRLTLLCSPRIPYALLTFGGEYDSVDEICRKIEAELKEKGIWILRDGKTFAKVVHGTEDPSAKGLDKLMPATVTIESTGTVGTLDFQGTPIQFVLRWYAATAGRPMSMSKDLPQVGIFLRNARELTKQECLQAIDNMLLLNGIKLIVLDGGGLGAIPAATPESKMPEVLAALIQWGNTDDYDYSVSDNKATITGFNKNYTGALTITNTLGGCPVASIGDYAFQRCTNLTSVMIPASVTNIGSHAFFYCSRLTNITIPASVTYVGENVFQGCTNLPTTIQSLASVRRGIPFRPANEGKSTIARSSHYSYTTNAAGQATVTGFSKEYSGDLSITNTLNGSPVTSIKFGAFRDCTNLTSVTIPASVTSIGNQAFFDCTGLTNITIPTSVTSIGGDALRGCTNLPPTIQNLARLIQSPTPVRRIPFRRGDDTPSISMTSGDYIYTTNSLGQATIAGFNKKYSGDLPITNALNGNPVTRISFEAFRDCTNLTSVTIPTSIISIGSFAFSGCTSLTNIAIPATITTVGNSAFQNCTNLPVAIQNLASKQSTFRSTPTTAALSLGNYSYTTNSFGQATITGFNKEYAGDLFITNTLLGSTVTAIRLGAFRGCTNLTSVTIPGSVTSIGGYAFNSCTSLTNVAIPASVTSIGYSAFGLCAGLKAITVEEVSVNFSSRDGVLFNKNQTAVLRCPGGKSGNYLIPTSVINIGDQAFNSCRRLTNITIPTTVTSIGDYAFTYCSGLTNVMIPANVTHIGIGAFSTCTSVKEFTIDTANATYTSLDGVLFNKKQTALIQCPSGKSGDYRIPASVTRIGDQAFNACAGLTNITVPTNVTKIGDYAFAYCGGLSSVTIPGSVTYLGKNAFQNCIGLTNVTISTGVKYSGENVFQNCPNLPDAIKNSALKQPSPHPSPPQ